MRDHNTGTYTDISHTETSTKPLIQNKTKKSEDNKTTSSVSFKNFFLKEEKS